MFSQAAAQPQVAVALAQLGNIFNAVGARQGSSMVCPRTRYKSRAPSKQGRPEISEATAEHLEQTLETNTCVSDQGEMEECVSVVAEENLSELIELAGHVVDTATQTTHGLHEHAHDTATTTDSYVSAETFFENRTGFEEGLLQTSTYRQPFWPFLTGNEAKLLLSPSVGPLLQQYRGFITRRGDGPSRKQFGFRGADKKEPVLKMKNADEMVSRLKESAGAGGNTEIHFHVTKEDEATGWKKYGRGFNRVGLFFGLVGLYLFFAYQNNKGKIPGLGVVTQPSNFEVTPEMVNVTFKDVKGIEETTEELQDLVRFLADQEKFKKLGAKIPKGVLLEGPPGVGKTLVAKAVAGEAGVPFFQASGSEFDEVFVGMGAKRVRALFNAAKLKAPCIVFIDEIDAVASTRRNTPFSSNHTQTVNQLLTEMDGCCQIKVAAKAKAPCIVFIDEIDALASKRTASPFTPHANQTINQLLSEMDGFSSKDGVIVIGATNNRKSLDKALLRPGRFDVEINVLPPDVAGRREILKLYLDKVSLSEEIDIDRVASLTYGKTGADINNIVNQAALKAVKENREGVLMEDMLYALDKVAMGAPRKARERAYADKWKTATHEAGHTIVAIFTKGANRVNKVTVTPRTKTLGHMEHLYEHDFLHSRTKEELLAQIDISNGGRVAEELFLGPNRISEGASTDLKNAAETAAYLVRHVGMSEKAGFRAYPDDEKMSNQQKTMLDEETNKILRESYERAKKVLESHKDEHKRLTEGLMKYETIDLHEIQDIIKGKPIRVSNKQKA